MYYFNDIIKNVKHFIKQKFKLLETTMDGYREKKWETIFDPKNSIKSKLKKKSKSKNAKNKIIKVNTNVSTFKYDEPLLQGVCLI